MIKTFFKELVVTLLLIVAVLLVLVVLFYDSIPNNKVIPEKITYSAPSELKSELTTDVDEQQEIIVTYRITDDDINKYKDQNSYNAGKVDPFAESPVSAAASENTTSNNNGSSNNNDNNNNSNNNGSSNTNGTNTNKNEGSSTQKNDNSSKGGLQK